MWHVVDDLVVGFSVDGHEVDVERVSLLCEPVVDLLKIDIGVPFKGVASVEVMFDFFGVFLVKRFSVIGRFEREFLHRSSP